MNADGYMTVPELLTQEGLDLIADFEGCRLKAYLCPAGVWTIGYGATRYEDGRRVARGDRITKDRARDLLVDLVYDFAGDVWDLTVDGDRGERVNPNQFSAMVSLAYNIGIGGFKRSSIYRNVVVDGWSAAASAFGLYVKARNPKTGLRRVLPGLVRRRKRETELFLSPWIAAPTAAEIAAIPIRPVRRFGDRLHAINTAEVFTHGKMEIEIV